MATRQVNRMSRAKSITISAIALLSLAACGGEQAEEAVAVEDAVQEEAIVAVSPKAQQSDDVYDGTVSKPGSPYAISYRIVGTPVVGSPLTIDLRVDSKHGPQPVSLEYRIIDATSLMLAESQPRNVRMEPAANEDSFRQQVTVIPQREGRFYLNVSASMETDSGTISTVTAIPIQVGNAPRILQQNGEEQLDENGEAVRVLSGDDN